jgi:hypothetical protein
MFADESGLEGEGVECTELSLSADLGFRSLTDLSNSTQGGQGARDDLGRPIAIHGIRSLRFQELGMREDNPELIIQAMKERLKVVVLLLRPVGVRADGRRRQAHACEPGAVLASESSDRAAGAASRHSVSAKIRMDPPAVRTYSTLPAEIQL